MTLDRLPGYVEDLYAVIPEDESETTNLELQFKVYSPLPATCVCVYGKMQPYQ